MNNNILVPHLAYSVEIHSLLVQHCKVYMWKTNVLVCNFPHAHMKTCQHEQQLTKWVATEFVLVWYLALNGTCSKT
jgi:hypothetical protein